MERKNLTNWGSGVLVVCSGCHVREATRETTGMKKRTFYCDICQPTTVKALNSLGPVSLDVVNQNKRTKELQAASREHKVAFAPKPFSSPSSIERAALEIHGIIDENIELRKRIERADQRAQAAEEALDKAMVKLREWEALADQMTRPALKLEGRS